VRRLQYAATAVTAIRGETANQSGFMTAQSRSTPPAPRAVPMVQLAALADLLSLVSTPAAPTDAPPAFISQYDGNF
jgi:hypothetical protein